MMTGEMTDAEVAAQVERADRFIEQLREAITATLSILRACARTITRSICLTRHAQHGAMGLFVHR